MTDMTEVERLIDVARDEWYPRSELPLGDVKFRDPSTRTAIEIHHGGAPLRSGRSIEDTWRAYARGHVLNRGWQDIWYNVGIAPDGRLFELRGPWAANSSRPFLTVNIPGHGDVDSTDAQFETLHKLRLAFAQDTGSTDLRWHAERGGTICPGPVVIQRIKAIRAAEAETGGLLVASEFTAPEENDPMIVDAVGPLVGPITVAGTKGYYVVGSDGGVFTFGDVPFLGSLPGKVPQHDSKADPIVGFAPVMGRIEPVNPLHAPTVGVIGYYLMSQSGAVFAFGDASWDGRVERIA
jgi:hypothetical protein